MVNFLENVLSYPRFFIVSLIGLISVLLSPLIFFFKTYPNKIIKILFFIFIFISLFLILKNMIEI